MSRRLLEPSAEMESLKLERNVTVEARLTVLVISVAMQLLASSQQTRFAIPAMMIVVPQPVNSLVMAQSAVLVLESVIRRRCAMGVRLLALLILQLQMVCYPLKFQNNP